MALDEPDIALLDATSLEGSLAEICRRISQVSPRTRLLLLADVSDEETATEARAAGARGLISKQIDKDRLLEVVHRVASGEILFEQVRHPLPNGAFDCLTMRQRDILDLISPGSTNRDIADSLYLAEKTVKNYVSCFFAKLGVRNRTEAAALWVRHEHLG